MTLYLEKIECSQRPQANHLFSSSFIDFVRFMLRRCQVGFNGIWSFDSPKSPFWQKVCTTTKEPLTMCRAQTITFIWLFFSMCQTQNVLGGPTCCELGFLNHQLIIGIFPHYFCVWIKLDRGSEEPSWTHPKKWS